MCCQPFPQHRSCLSIATVLFKVALPILLHFRALLWLCQISALLNLLLFYIFSGPSAQTWPAVIINDQFNLTEYSGPQIPLAPQEPTTTVFILLIYA